MNSSSSFIPSDTAWLALPSMNTPRSYFGASVISTDTGKNVFIVAGGINKNLRMRLKIDALNSAEMFDPNSQLWQQLPTMSTGRNGCAGVAVGTQFFVMGGSDRNDRPLSTMEMFDLETRKWTNLPPMITGRSYFAAVAVGNSILVFGGYIQCKGKSEEAEKYNLVERKWTPLPSMPTARFDCAAAAIGNKVYIVGGNDDDCSYLTTVECYDIDSGDWRTLPPMNHQRSGCSAASLGKRLFVVGGSGLDSAEVFDVETETWNFLPCMISERSGCAAAIMGDTLGVVGGYNSMDLSSLSEGEVWRIDKENKALIEETEAVKINKEEALKEQALTLAQRMKKLEDAFGLESVSDGMLRRKCCVLECEIFGKVQEGNLIHRIEKLESCMF